MKDRIIELLKTLNINAAQLADTIGVQRSSISHILSGRNKPSLDFFIKIHEAYPSVDLYHLITGKRLQGAKEDALKKSSQIVIEQDKSIEKIMIFYTDGTFKQYKEYKHNSQ